MNRKMVLLISKAGNPKTAINLVRYKPEEVVAIWDADHAGQTSQTLLGLGGDIPVIQSLDQAPGANTLVIGIAPSGGRLPADMRAKVLEAIARRMAIVSGLHEFLSDDPELSSAARLHNVPLVDVRKNTERDVAHRRNIRTDCLRIHTVGHDCNVGKMVVSLELAMALRHAGHDAKFVATGQTGMMIEGDGCPVDAVVVDFINGAAEKLVLANQHHDILLIEGQGSISHPRYSAVTLGLLHGCMPQGLIFCYEMGREEVSGMPGFKIPPLEKLRALYETMGNLMHPCETIGIAVNGRKYSDAEVARECERVSAELGLPACDVLRHGPGKLVDGVLAFQKKLFARTSAS
ncbi:MAG: DUF1611 domain-containing protein [Verrucomicrobiota bacterium]